MEFKKAPVAEVVIGTQFNGVVFNNQYIYDFYQEIKSSFPIIKENPILPSIIEKTEGPNEHRILPGFNSRRFFINSKESKLIQFQPDKLLLNWRKTSDEQEYPHFSTVLKEFLNVYNQLKNNCDLDNKLNQLEVTYVDHILMNDFDKADYNPMDILNIFNIKSKKRVKLIEHNISFPVEELKGNINLMIKSATRHIDHRKILVMESTCRGALNNHTMKKWFNLAHDKLLNLFCEITTENAKNIWEVQS